MRKLTDTLCTYTIEMNAAVSNYLHCLGIEHSYLYYLSHDQA